ncbi:MAG TPA: hypothetical protein VIJ85_03890 [Rhizomicrobium sp.]
MLWLLFVIVLFGALPILSVIAASGMASALHCVLDEGGTHRCMFMGSDIGDNLYVLFVSGWFMFVTLPAAAIATAVWGIAWVILKRRDRVGPGRARI